MDPRIVLLDYRVVMCDISLPQSRKKVLVRLSPVDVRGDRFLWQQYKGTPITALNATPYQQ